MAQRSCEISTDSQVLNDVLKLCEERKLKKVNKCLLQNPQLLLTRFIKANSSRFLMHEAITAGDREVCEILFDRAHEVRQVIEALEDDWRRTPVKTAIFHDRVEVLQLMLHYGYSLKFKSTSNLADTLEYAARNGSFRACRFFLKQSNAWDTIDLQRPFHKAVQGGYDSIVKLLLDYDANLILSQAEELGWRPIQHAASAGHISIIRQLYNYNADINSPYESNNSWLPLNIASSNGHHEAVFLLLQLGADPPKLENLHHYGCFRCYGEYGYNISSLASGDRFSDLLVFEELDSDMSELLVGVDNYNNREVFHNIFFEEKENPSSIEIVRLMLRIGLYVDQKFSSATPSVAAVVKELKLKLLHKEGTQGSHQEPLLIVLQEALGL